MKLCLEYDCKIVPYMHYEDNSYYSLKNIEEYHGYAENCPMVSIMNDGYGIHPLEMDFFKRESKRIYFIKQRYGGPSIDFYSPVVAEIKNNQIGPGFLSIYPSYYHYDQKFEPNKEFFKLFKVLSDYIKSVSIEIAIGKVKYRVGKDTINKFIAGKIEFVEMDGFNWNSLL